MTLFAKHSIIKLGLLLLIAIMAPAAALLAQVQATYYVDPINGSNSNSGTSVGAAFNTIDKARDVVRTINSNMTGDIYIYLRGGTYQLDSTLRFTDSDGGTNGFNIIYSAYNGERPVISGGKPITGWSMHDTCLNIYKAYAGDIETRHLFVNGVRAIRAKSTGIPSPLSFVKASGYTANGNIFANNAKPMDQWENLTDLEFVYRAEWTGPRVPVDSIVYDGTTTTITMQQPAWGWATNKGFSSVGNANNSSGMPFFIENAYELLDAEGEWYMNRLTDTIYYKPKSGENLSSATVIVPTLDELVRIQGSDLDHKAHNLKFIGITFNNTTDVETNSDKGHVDSQNNITTEELVSSSPLLYLGKIISAAVNLKYANAIHFENSVFEHLGNTGLNMYAGSQDNLVIGSRFTDISGNGIQVGDYKGWKTPESENYGNTSDTRAILRNNDVINNFFKNIGVEYYSSTAIGAAFPQDMDIVHNEIANVPYSGLHIGYAHCELPTTVHKNTHIEYNYVHEVMQVVQDGGAIYTLGKTGGDSSNMGRIANNYVQNQPRIYGALYLDNCSDWWNLSDNVVNNVPYYFSSGSTSHHVTVTNTFTTTSAITCANCSGVSISGTTVVSGGNWPAEAQLIIDSAGLQQPYLGLKSEGLPPGVQLYEHFDWMRVGEAPEGWTVNSAGGDGAVTVQEIPSATNKSMLLSKTGTSSGVDLVSSHILASTYSGTLEVKAKAGQTNAIALPIVLKSGPTSALEIAFNSNGQIAYKNASAVWVDIQAYTTGTWYNFKVEFDVVLDTYNFYIDGIQKLSNQAFAIVSEGIDTYTCVIKSASMGTANIDSVNLYEGYTARDNASLNKTVTGFSSQYNTTSFKAANINDGTVGAITSNVRGWASVSGSGTRNEWVKIDLNQVYTLSSFAIKGEDGGAGRNPKDYSLYGSATGAFSGEEFVIASGTIPSLTALGTHTVNFTPIDARYIKFKATTGYSNYIVVGELSVFGVLGAQPPTPPTPVSLNKTVTGFSSQFNATGYKATNINDGIVGSVTSNERGWASVTGSGTRNEWVTIDLGQTYTLDSLTIQNEDGANGRNVKDYLLYGSTTGAFAGEEFVISSGTIPSLTALATHSVNFTDVDVRYVKFKGTSSYSSYVIVGELSLFGVLAPQPPPTPVSLNKTVTGFSSQYNTSNWAAANINDGTVGSINSNEAGWASVSGSGTRNEWVKIDLGQTYAIDSFIIQNEAGYSGRNVKDYVLYGSTTGAFLGEEYVISSGTIPSLSALASYTVSFTPTDARYVKFKGTSSYSSYVIVGELSLYGVVVPPPTVVSLNKTVTGFSSQFNTTGYKATNINDGVVGSVTSNERGWASITGSGTRNEWVKIDLGQTYTLDSLTIQNEDGANGRNVKDYVLYGSATGAFAGEEFVISSGTIPSLSALGTHTVNFTAASARYVKFKGTSSYSSYVIVGELSLHGH